jgi:hypothetical protein
MDKYGVLDQAKSPDRETFTAIWDKKTWKLCKGYNLTYYNSTIVPRLEHFYLEGKSRDYTVDPEMFLALLDMFGKKKKKS